MSSWDSLKRELGLTLLDYVRWWHFWLAIKLGRTGESAAVLALMRREAELMRRDMLRSGRVPHG